ncbi:hypothetical protein CKO42_13255 [Lamprobacter modestohalophilus]|uniref:Periplasmic copper-binding protein NosD beta helix domain-containing protein n=1 Tax=Lamprobacter modestohalophilus TaxID=1064514 RepID=A0A9X0W9H2_9GAMM|nr:right-handed parallel beta-helix repeat-containing protein [Lamprobacter modestohalophilus]MBK1619389.1 hypothetical protein [Lamprobacter modestohalophilus]
MKHQRDLRSLSPVSGVLALLLAMPLSAADYFVSSAGSDDNPGSPEAPWRSIAKVNQTSLEPGDRVLFRRGDRWEETLHPSSSGAPGNPITYADFGGGVRPIITGAPNDHCIEWSTTRSHLVFRGLHLKDCGQPSGGTRGALAVWNEAADSRDILLEDSLLENAQTWNIYLTGIDGLRIRGNTIRNAEQQHGIYLDGTLGINDVVIEDNDIYGNRAMCVQFNSNGKNRLTNVTLRYNRLHDCGYGGLNNIGTDGLRAHHNLFYGAMPGIYNGCDGADAGCSRGSIGGVFANNTILTSGDGWSTCFSNESSQGTPDFSAFVNNICVHDASRGSAFQHMENTGGQNVDYNLFYSNRTDSPIFVWRGREYRGFDDYRSATDNEANGLFADPRFVDAGRGDMSLAADSPAIDSGTSLGFERDLEGEPVPRGSAPDRGAIEAASAEEPPETPSDLQIELQSSLNKQLFWR